jgi:uncharacterized spore protein YtfJ
MSKFQEMIDTIREHGSIKTVFGEPVTHGQRTVIPVARVWFGLGGGEDAATENVGGGMGVMAQPLGVYEITEDGTEFIPLRKRPPLPLAVGVLAGVVGLLIIRKRLAERATNKDWTI